MSRQGVDKNIPTRFISLLFFVSWYFYETLNLGWFYFWTQILSMCMNVHDGSVLKIWWTEVICPKIENVGNWNFIAVFDDLLNKTTKTTTETVFPQLWFFQLNYVLCWLFVCFYCYYWLFLLNFAVKFARNIVWIGH